MTEPDLPARILGTVCALRLVQPDDAHYVCELRLNPELNTHLSPVSGSVDDQRAWIESYKAREAAREEFYYVIERLDGERCGLVRLYDFTADSFTWGSWILGPNKPPKAALDSALLSFGVGFDYLDKPVARLSVDRPNERAIAFYRRFGMTEVDRSEDELFFTLDREQFRRDLPHYRAALDASEPKGPAA